MPNTYTPIATQTLASSATTVTFSSIPQTYTDLILVTQTTCGTSSNFYYIQVNGDTGNNYSYIRTFGDGSNPYSDSRATFPAASIGFANNTIPQTTVTHIASYANTSTYKHYLSRSNNTATWVALLYGSWHSTSAITSITCLMGSGDTTLAGSTFTLYGIKAA